MRRNNFVILNKIIQLFMLLSLFILQWILTVLYLEIFPYKIIKAYLSENLFSNCKNWWENNIVIPVYMITRGLSDLRLSDNNLKLGIKLFEFIWIINCLSYKHNSYCAPNTIILQIIKYDYDLKFHLWYFFSFVFTLRLSLMSNFTINAKSYNTCFENSSSFHRWDDNKPLI